MALASIPIQQSLLRRSYADDETFTIIIRADKALRIERSPTFYSNSSLRRMAGVAGAAPARCLAEQFAADEAVSGDWRMKEWLLSCAIGQRRLAWPLSHHATCGAPLSL